MRSNGDRRRSRASESSACRKSRAFSAHRAAKPRESVLDSRVKTKFLCSPNQLNLTSDSLTKPFLLSEMDDKGAFLDCGRIFKDSLEGRLAHDRARASATAGHFSRNLAIPFLQSSVMRARALVSTPAGEARFRTRRRQLLRRPARSKGTHRIHSSPAFKVVLSLKCVFEAMSRTFVKSQGMRAGTHSLSGPRSHIRLVARASG